MSYPKGLEVETDSSVFGETLPERDPTYTDMYIVYSTVGGEPLQHHTLIPSNVLIVMNNVQDTSLSAYHAYDANPIVILSYNSPYTCDHLLFHLGSVCCSSLLSLVPAPSSSFLMEYQDTHTHTHTNASVVPVPSGFVSFRHPENGSWLVEAICKVFMIDACNVELEHLMKKVG